jgi:hypothetical protein
MGHRHHQSSGIEVCRGHFHVSGSRYEIQLKKPLHTGHIKTAAAQLSPARHHVGPFAI